MSETWIVVKDNWEVVYAIFDEELDIIVSENIYCYEILEEVEEVTSPVVKQKYAHLKAM